MQTSAEIAPWWASCAFSSGSEVLRCHFVKAVLGDSICSSAGGFFHIIAKASCDDLRGKPSLRNFDGARLRAELCAEAESSVRDVFPSRPNEVHEEHYG